MPQFGLSPAFVVSRHGAGFTIDDYCTSATAARQLGFSSLQAEIYTPGGLLEWSKGGARRVAAHYASLGLGCSQFVAHFLLENFSSPAHLAASGDAAAVLRAIECAKAFHDCRVFTVPIAPFQVDPRVVCDERWHSEQRRRLVEKLRLYLELVHDAGLVLALEVLPFSLIGNIDGFLRIAHAINSPHLGLNLDTGHAWVTRELMPLLPAKLNGRLFGLHLKDGDGGLNQALAPGRGTIPWGPFFEALRASVYSGSLDLEIGCAPAQVETEYRFGHQHLAPFAAPSASAPALALSA